jgi:predicted CXXCH cytochrome family protein
MPFPYAHQATVDYSVEEGSCLNCHEAHGANLPVLLKQPYGGSEYQLCTQCHSVPPKHNYNNFHGSQWQGLPCSNCHVDIHGSYTSRWFLGPEADAQGCTRLGCHSS